MNQPYAGGWRYTSGDALQGGLLGMQGNHRVTPDFLRQVAAMQQPSAALSSAVEAKPLEGLLNAEVRDGNDRDNSITSTAMQQGMTPGGNPAMQDPGGLSFGFNPSAKSALGFAQGGILGGLLGSVTAQKTAPVDTLIAPGLNGYVDNNYGVNPALQGPTTQAQAQALAEKLARELAGYGTNDGYGGYGGMTGGSDTMGFGGEY